MLAPYLLALCRIVIGLIFMISFTGKVRNLPAFENAISHFRLLPAWAEKPVALLSLVGEFVVIILLVSGNRFLSVGFGLGALLLTIFSVALISVLKRSIQTSCNCFGLTERPVSRSDIARNVGFASCALCGLILVVPGADRRSLSVVEWALAGFPAAVFVAVWLHIGEIIRIFERG